MSDGQDVMLLELKPNRPWWRKPSLTCSLIWLMTCLVAITLGVGAAILIMRNADRPPRVLTPCGYVEGFYDVEPDVHIYKGIPYAAAPVGSSRWRRPVALRNASGNCWKGVLRAVNDEALFCARLDEEGNAIGAEDCLLLNVYTPSSARHFAQPAPLVPVLVWLDAGPMLGAAPASPGVRPAAREGFVYVNVQYRLGALGFLVADLLGNNQTGNYGLWDQIEALYWIRNNIANFGGDPKQVTLMTQGSGAASMFPLMTSPYAKGLFQRAWLLSVSPVIRTTLAEAKVRAASFIAKTKCHTLECLQDLPLQDLLVAAAEEWKDPFILNLPKKDQFQMPQVVIDGKLIPEDPMHVWMNKSGSYPDVPLLIGSMAHMAKSKIQQLNGGSDADYLTYMKTFLDTFSPDLSQKAVAAYNFSDRVQQQDKLDSMVADLRVSCGANILARNSANALKSKVFRYVVTNIPSSRSAEDGMNFDTYGWASFAYFGIEDEYLGALPDKDSDDEFVEIMQRIGHQFIRTGTVDGFEKAPNYTNLIGAKVTLLNKEYHKVQCDFWEKAGLLNYAWMN